MDSCIMRSLGDDDVSKALYISIKICKDLQISRNMYTYLWTSMNISDCLLISVNVCRIRERTFYINAGTRTQPNAALAQA